MMIDTNQLISMTEANQNFSKVIRMVEENGTAVILKNNKPKFVLIDYAEYDEIQTLRAKRQEIIESTADDIIEKNMQAFLELAK